MVPAPIESTTPFNVSDYWKDQPCGLTMGQATNMMPQLRTEMRKAFTRKYVKEGEANFISSDEDEETTTAAKINLRVNGKVQTAVVDSGAATSIITTAVQKRLGLEITSPSNLMVVTANGARTKSLGIVNNVSLSIGKLKINASFEVLESKDEIFILGNKWLRKVEAKMDYKQSTLTITYNNGIEHIPFTYTKINRVEMLNNPPSEKE